MEIIFHLTTKKISSDYQDAISEYAKRLSPFCKLTIKTYKNLSTINLSKSSKIYLISPSKNTIDSVSLADQINQLTIEGYSTIEYIISETENLDNIKETLLSSSNVSCDNFHISSFHLGVEMSATVMAEQIYRAFTILNNIKYHK